MARLVLKVEGLDTVLKKLNINKLSEPIQDAFDDFAINVDREAKQRAPVDEGRLRSAIFADTGKMSVEFGCAVNYASYLEFGTRKFAAAYVSSLPPTWREYAAQTQGKAGGSLDEFIQNIMAWVRRKGIGGQKTKSGTTSTSKSSLDDMQEAAYNIALNILQNGVKPHPFLYPAYEIARKQLISDLNNIKYA